MFDILVQFVFAKPMIGADVRRADEGEFPSIVAIKKKHASDILPENSRVCTGTLVTPCSVLTAAHCLDVIMPNETEVIVGSTDIRAGAKHYPLWWINCNQWAGTRNVSLRYAVNDVAVIRLTENVPPSIKPADLSALPNTFLYGLNVLAAGWGVLSDGSNPRFLHAVNLTLITNRECEEKIRCAHGSNIEVSQRILCSVSVPYALLTGGDSGCPILIEDVIVAVQQSIIPASESVTHDKKVNLHTSVVYYRGFILDVMKC